MSKVYIILVNWNGWKDTIECLESVFRLQYENFCVLVCDNDSTDGSAEKILAWASGRLAAGCENPALCNLSQPAVPKPIRTARIAAGGSVDLSRQNEPLILIETGKNLGFAGGTNVGLKLALQAGDAEYAWILNNDTVVDPAALTKLVQRLCERPNAGMCGSTLLSYADPNVIQALGGSEYNRWISRGCHIGGLSRIDQVHIDSGHTESQLDYIVGASMLVRRRLLEEVGLMSERYFLYFEEIDWALRAKSRFDLAYAKESVVYHKEGASTGNNKFAHRNNPLTDFYSARNRILVARQFFPYACMTTGAVVLLKALCKALRSDFKSALALLQGTISASAGNSGPRERR